MAVVVDSSFLVRLEREWMAAGRTGVPSLPADGVVSTITLMELAFGRMLAGSEARRAARAEFAEHVKQNLTVASFGPLEADAAAEIFAALRRAGTPIGERDLMIAATAVANGHSLVTLNAAEFARVPGLTILPDSLGASANP